jgi:hypothetical protein
MPRRNTNFKRFPRDIKSGMIFDSIYEAGIYYGVAHTTIQNYCNGNTKPNTDDYLLEWCTVTDLANEIKQLKDLFIKYHITAPVGVYL